MIESITVKELIAELKDQPQNWRIFLSSDPEGNSYNSLDKNYMVGGSNKDKVVVLYPIAQHLDDEVMPIETAEIMETIRKELK